MDAVPLTPFWKQFDPIPGESPDTLAGEAPNTLPGDRESQSFEELTKQESDHHFLVAWRYGQHAVVRRVWGRLSMGEFEPTSRAAAHRAALAAARAAKKEGIAHAKSRDHQVLAGLSSSYVQHLNHESEDETDIQGADYVDEGAEWAENLSDSDDADE